MNLIVDSNNQKKKVGIITFHFVNNFGGALQAFALSTVVKNECNADSYIIDYRRWFIRFTDFVRIFPITTNISEIFTGIKSFKARIGRIHKFKKFMKENCQLTQPFYTGRKISEKELNFNKYICGSDQIWNPILTGGICRAYFLHFVKNPQDKISYAPSFGTSRIPEIFLKKMGPMIDNIGYLSVREKEGQRLIKNLANRESSRMIDPTFLLGKESWESIAKKVEVPEHYILLYIMQQDADIYSHIDEINSKLNLPVVEISRYGYRNSRVEKSIVDIGPAEFIYLFLNADKICTNSYHGLVFSLIFRKELYLIPSKKFKGRMSNLLELLNIHPEGMLDSSSMYDLHYDNEEVEKVISAKRSQAIKYLRQGLNSNDN